MWQVLDLCQGKSGQAPAHLVPAVEGRTPVEWVGTSITSWCSSAEDSVGTEGVLLQQVKAGKVEVPCNL